MSLLQQKLQGAVDFLVNLAWLRGWKWTTSLQDLKWGLSTLMTPSRYERWKLCLERTYLVYDQEYRKRLRVASRHTSIIRVHCQVVFVIEWSLIHNNNIINTFRFVEEISLRVNCEVIFGERLSKFWRFKIISFTMVWIWLSQREMKTSSRLFERITGKHWLLCSHLTVYLAGQTRKWVIIFYGVAHRYRFVVPGILAVGGAMRRFSGYLTLEVEQRLRGMEADKRDIPVGHI